MDTTTGKGLIRGSAKKRSRAMEPVKIKALRNCRAGGKSLVAGETYELHEATARKLIKIGKAAPGNGDPEPTTLGPDSPVDDLGLGEQPTVALVDRHLKTVGDVVDYMYDGQLTDIKGIGKATASKITEALVAAKLLDGDG